MPLIGGSQTVPAGVRRIGAVNTSTSAPAADVTVAVLDTGVDLAHPDLNVVAGTNCIAPGTPPNDVQGHGTHCAGSIGAKNDAGGVIGVAPGTKIVAVKVSHGAACIETAQHCCAEMGCSGVRPSTAVQYHQGGRTAMVVAIDLRPTHSYTVTRPLDWTLSVIGGFCMSRRSFRHVQHFSHSTVCHTSGAGRRRLWQLIQCHLWH